MVIQLKMKVWDTIIEYNAQYVIGKLKAIKRKNKDEIMIYPMRE